MDSRETYTILTEMSSAILADGNNLKARAEGYSMYPFIKPGSIVTLAPVNEETILSPGDIIAWKREAGFVMHRLASITRTSEGDIYITRGDSCINFDIPVTRSLISGKVITIEDRKGRIRKGDELIVRPFHKWNRARIWLLFKIRRLLTIFGVRRAGNEK